MKHLLRHLAKYKKECVLSPLFKLTEALLELFVPLVVATIIDNGIARGDRNYILSHVLLMFLLALLGLAVSITAQYFSARAASLFSRDVKHSLFKHIQSLSKSETDKIGVSTLLTRMNSDMMQVQSGVNMTLRLLLRSPFIVFGALIMAFTVDAKVALVFLVVLIILIVIVTVLMSISLPRFKKVQGGLDEVTERTRENHAGVRVVRAFCLEESESEKFLNSNENLRRLQLFASKISALTNPLTSVFINLGIIAILYTGAIRVDSGSLTQGQVIALVNYMNQILVELIKLANLIITISKALSSAKRVEEVFNTEPSQTFGSLASFDYSAPAIEFSGVTFRYNDASHGALNDISFKVEKGESVGVIGGTGSGKSTLCALLLRFYDASEGEIKLFGKDIREYDEAFLRSHVTAALQKARLISGTIRSNLLAAKATASEENMVRALERAQAWEFVEAKGLDAKVEAGGKNFSGGQRQRLSLARALISEGDILILDDSSSALDYATDRMLRSALATLECTKIIISQRAASLMHADKILVLDNGELSDMGTHESLLKTSALYKEIYDSQFREERNV